MPRPKSLNNSTNSAGERIKNYKLRHNFALANKTIKNTVEEIVKNLGVQVVKILNGSDQGAGACYYCPGNTHLSQRSLPRIAIRLLSCK